MVDRLLSIIAPHSCCSCGNLGSILCQFCKNDIISDPFSACFVCLNPTFEHNLCSSCANEHRIEAGWCVGVRESQLKALLDRYKFDSAKQAGQSLADLLDHRLPQLPPGLTVVPVPTSSSHKRVRGFDHTALVATRFASLRQLPYKSVLMRHGNDTQHFKSRADRLKTAANTLEVAKALPESVLLVDDIYTTGATMRACVERLHSAGVKQIFVAIIARQTLDVTPDLW